MKKFIKKTVIYTFTFICLSFLLTEIIIRKAPYFSSKFFITNNWLKTNYLIEKSKKNILNDTIYIGDSVGQQLLSSSSNDETNKLLYNAATLPVGSYFLTKNAINANKNIKTVIYYITPKSLARDFSSNKTNSYFVKAFYTFENRNEILANKNLKNLLVKNRFLDLNLFNFYKLLKLSDFNYSDGKSSEFSISNESIEWIEKIDSLCKVNNVKFHMASPPLPEILKKTSNNWALFRQKALGTKNKDLFNTYFKTIIYYDDIYSSDNLHMNRNFQISNSNYFFNLMIKVISEEK